MSQGPQYPDVDCDPLSGASRYRVLIPSSLDEMGDFAHWHFDGFAKASIAMARLRSFHPEAERWSDSLQRWVTDMEAG